MASAAFVTDRISLLSWRLWRLQQFDLSGASEGESMLKSSGSDIRFGDLEMSLGLTIHRNTAKHYG